MPLVVGELIALLALDDKPFQQGLKQAETRWSKAAKDLTDLGKSLTVGFSLPLAGAGAAALKLSTDFNRAMANVATLIPRNERRIDDLKRSVEDLSIETARSATDLADGLYEVVSAFGDTAESADILRINARAAAAGLSTVTDAVNLTSAVTKGYGDTSAEAVQHVADLAFMATNLGQTTFPELAASVGRVVPIAASLGVSMEDLFGVMATATGVTGTAAEVSTQFRGILQSLMAPTDAMTGLLSDLGVESGKALLQQQGLQRTIELIVRAAEESGRPLQDYIGSIEGQTLALALAGPQAQSFTEKLQAMQNVVGATDEAFREQAEGINRDGFAFEQALRRAEQITRHFGDELAPALHDVLDAAEPMVDVVGGLVEAFGRLPEPMKNSVMQITALGVALGPALALLGGIATLGAKGAAGLSAFGKAWPAITNALRGAANPLALVIALETLFGDEMERVRIKLTSMQPQIDAVMKKIAEQGATTANVTELIKIYQTALDELVRNGMDPAGQGAKHLQATIDQLKGLLKQSTPAAKDVKAAIGQMGGAADDAADSTSGLNRELVAVPVGAAKAQAAFDGVTDAVVAALGGNNDLAESFEPLIQRLIEAGRKAGGFDEQIRILEEQLREMRDAGEEGTFAFGVLSGVYDTLRTSTERLGTAFKAANLPASHLVNITFDLRISSGLLTGKLGNLEDQTRDLLQPMGQLVLQNAAADRSFDGLADRITDLIPGVGDLLRDEWDLSVTTEDLTGTVEDLGEAALQAANNMARLRMETGDTAGSARSVDEAWREFLNTQNQSLPIFTTAKQGLIDWKAVVVNAFGTVDNVARTMATTIVEGFNDMAEGQKSFGDVMKETLLRVLDMIEVEIIAQTALAVIKNLAVFNFAGAAAAAASGAAGVIAVEAGKAIVRGLAEGGVITSPGTVLVGERGPELLNLPRGASVIPLDHPAAAGFVGAGAGRPAIHGPLIGNVTLAPTSASVADQLRALKRQMRQLAAEWQLA